MSKKREKIIELLRSGNFTITYHDNDYCCLYKGHLEYDELPKKEIQSFSGHSDGYITEIVEVLVEALGGKVDSI